MKRKQYERLYSSVNPLVEHEKTIEKQNAHRRMNRQILSGELRKVSELICADCGRRAEEYHHTTYKIPDCDAGLVALCKTCHNLRHLVEVTISGLDKYILDFVNRYKDGAEIKDIVEHVLDFDFQGKELAVNWNYDNIESIVRSYLKRYVSEGCIVVSKSRKWPYNRTKNYYYPKST